MAEIAEAAKKSMSAPEPVYKGLFTENATGKQVHGFFLKHHADAGEAEGDDCFITISKTLDVGLKLSGESGLYPPDDFKSGHTFLMFPKSGKSFGS